MGCDTGRFMKVWLVGAKGMLGRSVSVELSGADVEVVGTDAELDICDEKAVAAFAQNGAFTHVINCAAFTNVDGAESEEALATQINGQGVAHLWSAVRALKATLLHISTDYVFDGTATSPYLETDATEPLGAYGRSKLAGEIAIQSQPNADARAFILRTSWLFGPHGKSFVTTMLRLFDKLPELRVVADQRGRPSYCPDLARAGIELVGLTGKDCAPGIYHFAQTGDCSWHEFACAILERAQAQGMAQATQSVQAITTEEYPTPAKRPAYSVLSTDKLTAATGHVPRNWEHALDDFIEWTAEQNRIQSEQ